MNQAPSLEPPRSAEATLLAMAYGGLRLSVVMTLAVYVIFTGFVLQRFPASATHAWGIALVAIALLRYGLWVVHRRVTRDDEPHPHWRWRALFVVGATAAGASWAVGPVLLVPTAEPAAALLLALVVLAVSAVSIATLDAESHALFGFVIAAILPTAAVLGFADDELMRLGGAVMFASMLTLIVVGRRSSATTRLLVQSELRATELDRMKSAFLGMAAHELRTPMTGILGYSELLSESPQLSDEPRNWAHTVNAEAVRLKAIVEDLLNVSRIEAGAAAEALEPVRLITCVSTALRSVDSEAEQGRFLVDVDDGLYAMASPQRLLEVIENLISNAVKYSPQGGPVTIAAIPDGDRLRLSVRDEGLGIPDEAIESLFDRFQRIDSPDRAQIRGTGLGLYIVKRYVESFDGSIEVSSVEGEGSTFTAVLPRSRDAARAA